MEWAGGGSGLSLVCPSADLSIWNSCLPWALSAGGWVALSKMSDKIAATCCMDQSLQRPQRMAGQTGPLFSYLAWLALRMSWVESGLGVREVPAEQGWCVTLRESQ